MAWHCLGDRDFDRLVLVRSEAEAAHLRRHRRVVSRLPHVVRCVLRVAWYNKSLTHRTSHASCCAVFCPVVLCVMHVVTPWRVVETMRRA